MKQPTIGKAVTRALKSRKTWGLALKMWIAGFAGFAILSMLGVAAGAPLASAKRYLGEMTALVSFASPTVALALKAYYGYREAMGAWKAGKRLRRATRRCIHI